MDGPATKVFGFVLVLGLVAFPAGLSAKERRGATVVVAKLDGTAVAGELVAVKPEGLLVLSSGTGVTVGLAEIRTVRLVRRSRALLLAIGGFVAGAAEGAYVASRDEEDRTTATTLLAAGLCGGGQALLGLGIGLGLGADAVLPFAGEPEAIVANHIEKLKGRSREGRIRIAAEPGPITPARAPVRAGLEPGAPRRLHRPRFRLSAGIAYNVGDTGHIFGDDTGSWRFPGDVPSDEAGPFMLIFHEAHPQDWDVGPFRLAPVGLAYELTRHWLAEIEWFHASGRADLSFAIPEFVSTQDGKTYQGVWPGPPYPAHQVRCDALLVGLGYRPLAPGPLSRLALEIGAAAGPAWFRISPDRDFIPGGRKTALAVRVRAAFDFYFVPALSLGVFADYRRARADLPAVTGAGEMAFHEIADTYPYTTEPLVRLTELTVPGRSAAIHGPIAGARITVRF